MHDCCSFLVSGLTHCAAKHRFDTLYGEQCARLDRDQRVRGKLTHANSCPLRVASAVLFGMNKPITKEIDSLYVDNMVYTMHWHRFMRKMLGSWRDARLTVCAILNGLRERR